MPMTLMLTGLLPIGECEKYSVHVRHMRAQNDLRDGPSLSLSDSVEDRARQQVKQQRSLPLKVTIKTTFPKLTR
jgi:hypothetical protein